jgi:hypothetical protein
MKKMFVTKLTWSILLPSLSQKTLGGGDPTATHSRVRSELNGAFITAGRLRSNSNHLLGRALGAASAGTFSPSVRSVMDSGSIPTIPQIKNYSLLLKLFLAYWMGKECPCCQFHCCLPQSIQSRFVSLWPRVKIYLASKL